MSGLKRTESYFKAGVKEYARIQARERISLFRNGKLDIIFKAIQKSTISRNDYGRVFGLETREPRSELDGVTVFRSVAIAGALEWH